MHRGDANRVAQHDDRLAVSCEDDIGGLWGALNDARERGLCLADQVERVWRVNTEEVNARLQGTVEFNKCPFGNREQS